MGRKRTNPTIRLPDRIPASDLANWMRVNGISTNQLALELSVRYRTVDGWLRGYRPAPAWLEQRINYRAVGPNAKLPPYGERWPEPQQPAPRPLPATVVTPATCECGAAFLPDGKCSFLFCPFSDDDEPDGDDQ